MRAEGHDGPHLDSEQAAAGEAAARASASSSAAFDAVEAGRCDALILDVPIVVSQSKKKKGAYGGVAGQIVTNEFYGAVMEKGSKFKPFLDRAIGTLRANGTITRLQKRWLPFTRVPVLK